MPLLLRLTKHFSPTTAKTRDWGSVCRRLGLFIPMTPWPVLIWIQTHPGDNWTVSPHGNEPLYAVRAEAMMILGVTSAGGFCLILAGALISEHLSRQGSAPREANWRWFPWLALWLVNAYLLFNYVASTAVAYG